MQDLIFLGNLKSFLTCLATPRHSTHSVFGGRNIARIGIERFSKMYTLKFQIHSTLPLEFPGTPPQFTHKGKNLVLMTPPPKNPVPSAADGISDQLSNFDSARLFEITLFSRQKPSRTCEFKTAMEMANLQLTFLNY